MKKEFLVFAIALTGCSIALSQQTYYPLPTEDAIWVEGAGGYQSGYCADYHYKIIRDTTVNDFTYHVLRKIGVQYSEDSWGNCTDQIIGTFNYYSGAFRNDIINRKVYYLPPGETTDTILYDFNLSVGEALPVSFINDTSYHKNYVSRKDSILIDGSYHNRYWISDSIFYGSPFEFTSIIEGIGSELGLISVIFPPFEFGTWLECLKLEGQTIFPYSGYNCSLITGLDDQTQNYSLSSISPNPFTTSTTFEYYLEKSFDVTIIIYNSQGQVVERIQERQDKGVQRVTWSAEGLPRGMYYYSIYSGFKTGSGKLIKMR